MRQYFYVYFLLLGAVPFMLQMIFWWSRKRRHEKRAASANAMQSQPQQKPSISYAQYCSPELDSQGLEKLNRDLHKLNSSKEESTKWILGWMCVMIASLVLGVLTHNDMVFNIGMLFAIVGIFSYVIFSTIGFQCLLSRTKKRFWGEIAPRLLQQTFSKYGAEVTGSGKKRQLSGGFSLEKEAYRVQVQFSAQENYVRGTNQKDSYYSIGSCVHMHIVPAVHPAPHLDLELRPRDGSALGKMLQKGSAALSQALSDHRGGTSAREEVFLEDENFRSRFRAISSQSAAAEAFLTENQRRALMELSRYLGKMKIRYCEGSIAVTFYGIELAGYSHMSHTGLPFTYTQDHMASLLQSFETVLLNLPVLWQPLAAKGGSESE